MANRFAEKFQQGLTMGQGLMDTYEKAKMRKELREANALQQEQQQLGLNPPTEGAVPTGYEDYIARDTQTGAFRPVANIETNPEEYARQGVMAERFNQPTAFQGAKTSYSLGGVSRDTAFTPEEIARARMERKADIYSNYGKEDLAEQMRSNALQREAATLTIAKQKKELAKEEAFERDRNQFVNEAATVAEKMQEAREALDAGDRYTAGNAIVAARTLMGDKRMIKLNKDGLFEGSEDNGATWIQSKGDNNVYNPGVVERMMGELDKSLDQRGKELFSKHADKKDWYQMTRDAKEDGYKEKVFKEQLRQFGVTTDLKREELLNQVEQARKKYDLDVKELALKGLLNKAQIAAYNASAQESRAKSDYYGLGPRDISYLDDGTAVTYKKLPSGGLQTVPVVDVKGNPVKGSQKSTGENPNVTLTDQEKIAYKAYTDQINDNPRAYETESARIDLATRLGLDPKRLNMVDPYAKIVTPQPKSLKTSLANKIQAGKVTTE